jgi:conjugative transfer signal peptidase TraF
MTRFLILLTGYCALGALVAPALVRPSPRLVWNMSASVPVGLYRALPANDARRGDLVAALPPAPLARLMAERRYLPLDVPMLKHVAAMTGDTVCRFGMRISVGGKLVAEARLRDRAGRALPTWRGCVKLRADQVFLLNPGSADSFDGRYFGAISRRAVVARLDPLWLPGGTATGPHEPRSSPQTK